MPGESTLIDFLVKRTQEEIPWSSFNGIGQEDRYSIIQGAMAKLLEQREDYENLDHTHREKKTLFIKAATQYIRIGAELGHGWCQFDYATCLLDGKGTNQDKEMGIVFLKRAASNGVKEAENLLRKLMH